jgi:predicted DNA-binding transcriptional regulator YafY
MLRPPNTARQFHSTNAPFPNQTFSTPESRRLSAMPSKNSHRGDMTERLILIPLLLAERPHTQSELASKCQVNNVTIRRDIDHLTPYYRIEEDRDGREKIYRFGEGYQYTPPNFTPAELATLLLAQQTIATTGLTSFGTPLANYGRALLAKVRSALPKDLRNYLDTLANIFGTALTPAKDFSPHADTIDKLTKVATP